jgi:hypothetical protein
MNSASDWIFNFMLWGAIVTLLVLIVNQEVTPILGAATTLIALVFVVVVSALWPKW